MWSNLGDLLAGTMLSEQHITILLQDCQQNGLNINVLHIHDTVQNNFHKTKGVREIVVIYGNLHNDGMGLNVCLLWENTRWKMLLLVSVAQPKRSSLAQRQNLCSHSLFVDLLGQHWRCAQLVELNLALGTCSHNSIARKWFPVVYGYNNNDQPDRLVEIFSFGHYYWHQSTTSITCTEIVQNDQQTNLPPTSHTMSRCVHLHTTSPVCIPVY